MAAAGPVLDLEQFGELIDGLDENLFVSHEAKLLPAELVHDPYGALARDLGTSAAALAHRYALSMTGVDTVVLGCKNRREVLECVAAAEAGPLERAIMARVDASFEV